MQHNGRYAILKITAIILKNDCYFDNILFFKQNYAATDRNDRELRYDAHYVTIFWSTKTNLYRYFHPWLISTNGNKLETIGRDISFPLKQNLQSSYSKVLKKSSHEIWSKTEPQMALFSNPLIPNLWYFSWLLYPRPISHYHLIFVWLFHAEL